MDEEGELMPPPAAATIEIELRRASLRTVVEKLELTTGLRFALRRARVTAAGSRWIFETVAPSQGRHAI
jgi:hypothetical protein